jgi:hypothetical protein
LRDLGDLVDVELNEVGVGELFGEPVCQLLACDFKD